jgi:DNA mismatch repair protein MutS2
MIYPQTFEKKVGFDKIRFWLYQNCMSALGKENIDNITFSDSYEIIKKNLNLTEEFINIIEIEKDFEITSIHNNNHSLKRAKLENSYIEIADLSELRKNLETTHNILSFFEKDKENKYYHLKELSQQINYQPIIIERINKILDRNEILKDNASPELAKIRQQINHKKKLIASTLSSIINKAKEEGIIEPESETTIRDGRHLIPVNYTHKRKIKGYIYDSSASGKTIYIEPLEIIELDNEIKELLFSEKREIIKILTEFCNFLRPYIDDLLIINEFLGKIDFIRAKAIFSINFKCHKPNLINNTLINIREGRHPILQDTLSQEGKKIVPLNIKLNNNNRIMIISGPNAGGKSVCIKTIGLLQYMLQCGIPIPASENSEMGIFKNIFIDIGDEQSIENDLSTYSSHLINMKFFIKNSDNRTLFLIDEFGAGTDPTIGGAMAKSILEKLNQQGAFGIVTTHYSVLKQYASSAKNTINAAMLFDVQKIQPLFILQTGSPGSSFAFDISRKIGLPEEIIKRASEIVGEDYVNYEENLRKIIRDKNYWNEKRENINLLKKELETTIAKYEEELTKLKKSRNDIIENAKNEAKELIKNINKKIENTISEIKKVQAEKEKTKLLREQLINDLRETENNKETPITRIGTKDIKRDTYRYNLKKTRSDKNIEAEKPLKIGDKVEIKGQNIAGEIITIDNNKCTIAFGNIKAQFDKKNLAKISNKDFNERLKQVQKGNIKINFRERIINFKTQIDLRGKKVEEAIAEVSKYLDDAIIANASQIKILHGKGNGILRNAIRDYLSNQKFVESFEDEHAEMGGAGITVVNLKL